MPEGLLEANSADICHCCAITTSYQVQTLLRCTWHELLYLLQVWIQPLLLSLQPDARLYMPCVYVRVSLQSWLALCEPMDYSRPLFSVHGILQARILDWVAFPFSRRSSQPRDGTQVSCIAGRFFTIWATREAHTCPNYHLTCLLRNLYADQEATVRTGHGTTDWFQIGKGVCQGCVLSLCLFNLYAEYIMRNTGLDEAQARIKISRRNVNNFRYADDTTLKWQKVKRN